ncbi:TetR/AcrR family transcriptional regulator [Aminobacter anthyllidis]|uniref:TetR/AcrR family transcriptional regulator n=1 Tax=Aminobacter anthyllidis TaxID=1035067 RepID=A0A9X1D6I2_9HYPH|nr:TetR/AcrR family transcriptional regulator [Aminobacter anthyllidis]MBT1156829.1 TetR/AcrR family transcriptional regulator [Aminobacter anthyllidis]
MKRRTASNLARSQEASMVSAALIHLEDRVKSVKRAKVRFYRNPGVRAESLLEAALECFAEEDYESVTIPLIAKKLGVAHSLIYYYFKNKDSLYQSSVLHALDRLMTNYGEVVARHDSPAELLSAYLDLNVEMSETLRSLVRIMFVNAGGASDAGPKFIDSFVEDFYESEKRILADCIRQGVEIGMFTCPDPEEMAAFISRNIDGIYFGSFMPHGAPIPAAMRYLKEVTWGLLHYAGDARTKTPSTTKSGR